MNHWLRNQHRRRILLGGALAGATGLATLLTCRQGKPNGVVPSNLPSTESTLAERRAGLCSASNVSGVGLQGQYFSEPQLRGASLLVRTDAQIDFDAALDWPAELAGRLPASVRWRGWVKVPVNGIYRFHAELGEGRLVVSNAVVMGHGAPADASIALPAGRFCPLQMELPSLAPTATARIRLEWTMPHGARFVVPQSLLFLPSELAGVQVT